MEQDNIYGQPKQPMQGAWFSMGEDLEPAAEGASGKTPVASFEPTPGESVLPPEASEVMTQVPVVPSPVSAPVSESRSAAAPAVENQSVSAAQFAARQIPVFFDATAPESGKAETETLSQVPVKPSDNGRAKDRKGSGFLRGVAVVVIMALLAMGTAAVTAGIMDARFQKELKEMENRIDELDERRTEDIQPNGGDPDNGGNIQNGNGGGQSISGELLTPAQVYQMNLDSVVMIYNEIKGTRYSAGATYTGTGFVISSDGYVVTNYHVVEGDGELSVVTPSGQEFEAELIGFNNANDVALLKVDGENMQAVTKGDSDSLIVGDQVVAIGNPLGELTSTLTVGYISAKGRDVNTSGFAINMLQTDAAINSGNSGGPLFNMRGEVVGITTAKYSGSSGSGATIEGIGFAIPIDDVWDLIEDWRDNGRETGPYLGVSVRDTEDSYGVHVVEVVEGYCCHKAGVQTDDIILELAGNAVNSVNELSRVLRSLEPGEEVEVKILRGRNEKTLQVVLDEKPAE